MPRPGLDPTAGSQASRVARGQSELEHSFQHDERPAAPPDRARGGASTAARSRFRSCKQHELRRESRAPLRRGPRGLQLGSHRRAESAPARTGRWERTYCRNHAGLPRDGETPRAAVFHALESARSTLVPPGVHDQVNRCLRAPARGARETPSGRADFLLARPRNLGREHDAEPGCPRPASP